MDLMITARDLRKRYVMGEGNVVEALRGVDLDIERGSFIALMGPSGSGKSTLLNLFGSLDRPTSGSLIVGGRDLASLPAGRLPDVRRELVGFVFQGFNLIPTLDALENVLMPLRYGGLGRRRGRQRAIELLEQMGLGGRLHHRPHELSGGEQQRVAIARALIMDPPLILADEPTGEVDSSTGEVIMGILKELNDRGETVLVVTHDPFTASYAERVVRMRDGMVESTGLE